MAAGFGRYSTCRTRKSIGLPLHGAVLSSWAGLRRLGQGAGQVRTRAGAGGATPAGTGSRAPVQDRDRPRGDHPARAGSRTQNAAVQEREILAGPSPHAQGTDFLTCSFTAGWCTSRALSLNATYRPRSWLHLRAADAVASSRCAVCTRYRVLWSIWEMPRRGAVAEGHQRCQQLRARPRVGGRPVCGLAAVRLLLAGRVAVCRIRMSSRNGGAAGTAGAARSPPSVTCAREGCPAGPGAGHPAHQHFSPADHDQTASRAHHSTVPVRRAEAARVRPVSGSGHPIS